MAPKKQNLVSKEGLSALNCIDAKMKKNLKKYEEREERYKDRTIKGIQDVKLNVPDNYQETARKNIYEKNNPGKKWEEK